jgi:cytochrome c
MSKWIAITAVVAGVVIAAPLSSDIAQASQHMKSRSGTPSAEPDHMTEGLMMPKMDPAKGRQLFATKGCVVCHAVNGIGGQDAPPLDASTMPLPMDPFEFAARMWRGAEAMIVLQRDELGEQIELNGRELADIIAFAHNEKEQKKFAERDIPQKVRRLIDHSEKEGRAGHHKN